MNYFNKGRQFNFIFHSLGRSLVEEGLIKRENTMYLVGGPDNRATYW